MASDRPSELADSMAKRLIEAFGESFQLSVGGVFVTASIGIARSTGATDALDLIRDADTAMYKAKGLGGNKYEPYDSSLRDQVRTKLELEQALRGALERGELSVHYQPIVDLQTDELTGFEALMRWTHPTIGVVSPMQFIPIAEETGLIDTSGAWLLEEAASQLVRWRAERPDGKHPLHMSVNLAVRQLRDPRLVDIVKGILERTGLSASELWLEITESGAMQDLEVSLARLRELHELGITLCIDDFGTGYSSLSYLSQIPAKIVKIDRSFINRIGIDSETEAIVRSVVAMSAALDRIVVAEGIETVEQRDWLRALGCELAQGYFYGPPRAAVAQSDWLRHQGTGPTIWAQAQLTHAAGTQAVGKPA
jgi:EAL domain-containing protein (putative c-di-GMP-specific phosphodiesterase class I)